MVFVAYRIDIVPQKNKNGDWIIGKYEWELAGQRGDTLNWKEIERAPETEAGFESLRGKARTLATNGATIYSGGCEI